MAVIARFRASGANS